jgi:hypothetical protein
MLSAYAFVAAAPRIEPLREADIDYGCGCSFHIPPDLGAKGVAILQWEDGSKANMRVDGKLQKLNVVTKQPATSAMRPEQVGDEEVFELQGGGVSVRAVCTVTEVCAAEDESCEVTIFRAKVTIRTSAGTKVLKTWAACGC